MSKLPELKVGDAVHVSDVNMARMGSPDGWSGVVVSIGRKYASVEYDHHVGKFDKQTGIEAGKYGHAWIQTPQQRENAIVRGDALKELQSLGITLVTAKRAISTEKLIKILEIMQTD